MYMIRREKISVRAKSIYVICLFVIWLISAGVFTFVDPYTVTGNGYFACWVGLACTVKLLSVEVPHVKNCVASIHNLGLLMGFLVVASFVTTIAAIRPCVTEGEI